jgi:hypothetical protein
MTQTCNLIIAGSSEHGFRDGRVCREHRAQGFASTHPWGRIKRALRTKDVRAAIMTRIIDRLKLCVFADFKNDDQMSLTVRGRPYAQRCLESTTASNGLDWSREKEDWVCLHHPACRKPVRVVRLHAQRRGCGERKRASLAEPPIRLEQRSSASHSSIAHLDLTLLQSCTSSCRIADHLSNSSCMSWQECVVSDWPCVFRRTTTGSGCKRGNVVLLDFVGICSALTCKHARRSEARGSCTVALLSSRLQTSTDMDVQRW